MLLPLSVLSGPPRTGPGAPVLVRVASLPCPPLPEAAPGTPEMTVRQTSRTFNPVRLTHKMNHHTVFEIMIILTFFHHALSKFDVVRDHIIFKWKKKSLKNEYPLLVSILFADRATMYSLYNNTVGRSVQICPEAATKRRGRGAPVTRQQCAGVDAMGTRVPGILGPASGTSRNPGGPRVVSERNEVISGTHLARCKM